MATVVWNGGASLTAQVWKGSVTTTTAGHTYIVTLTAEDGTTTAAVTYTCIGSEGDTTDVAEGFVAAWNLSSNSLISKLTASNSTNQVILTADTAGIPFSPAASGTGTWSGTGTTTSNSGPNDWGTAANWSTAAVPVTNDIVVFNNGWYDVLYSLNQSAVNLNQLKIGKGYKGIIGDVVNSYYLQIDVNGAATKQTRINTGGQSVWLKGTLPTLYVIGTATNEKAVNVSGTLDNIFIIGGDVVGHVNFANNSDINNIDAIECPGAFIDIGEDVTNLTQLRMKNTRVRCKSGGTSFAVTVASGSLEFKPDTESVDTTVQAASINNWGGFINFNGGGTISALNNFSGTFDVSESEAEHANGVVITNATVWGGLVKERSALTNVTWTNPVTVYGGRAEIDSGTTMTV